MVTLNEAGTGAAVPDATGEPRPDALTVVDLKPGSSTYGQIGRPAGHAQRRRRAAPLRLERLLAPRCARGRRTRTSSAATCSCPGLRSSRIHVIDVKEDPVNPKLVKVIEADELHAQDRLLAARTPSHCGPDGLYVRALGAPDGGGPGGVFLLDHDDFDLLGPVGDRPRAAAARLRLLVEHRLRHAAHQRVGHAGHGRGRRPARAAAGRPVRPPAARVGPQASAATRRRSTSARSSRWCSSCARRTTRRKAYGFVGVVVSTADLSASVWLWERGDDGKVEVRKVIEIPAEPAEAEQLPPALAAVRGGAAAGDRHRPQRRRPDLYVSCWGTGELKRYDVSDPRNPRETGSVRLGGIVRAARTRPRARSTAGRRWSRSRRDGRRVYLTNSLYAAWDAPVLPRGDQGLDGQARRRRRTAAWPSTPTSSSSSTGERPHQVRLQGGDACSDSYCFP